MDKNAFLKVLRISLYVVLPGIVFLTGIISKDAWYFIVLSIIATVYLLLLNEGKRIAYLLCFVYAVGYGVASFFVKLYAGAVYHLLVLAPVAIYRFITFYKEDKSEPKAIGLKGWIICLVFVAALTTGLYFLLRHVGGSQPFFDAAVLSISVATAILMFGNYRELWCFNALSTILYIIIWTIQFITVGTGLALVIAQSIVLLINIRGIILWSKQTIKNNNLKN